MEPTDDVPDSEVVELLADNDVGMHHPSTQVVERIAQVEIAVCRGTGEHPDGGRGHRTRPADHDACRITSRARADRGGRRRGDRSGPGHALTEEIAVRQLAQTPPDPPGGRARNLRRRNRT